MSHSLKGHLKRMCYSEELWQSVIHWRREWQNYSSILAVRTLWTVWKGKNIWHQKMTPPPRSEGVQYTTVEEQINISRKNEKAGPKQKWHSILDVSGGETEVQCCKEYHIGAWNVRSMNQGKKQSLAIKIRIVRALVFFSSHAQM